MIDFFWEPGSPYTYLAATRIGDLGRRHGLTVNWRPFLLGKVFEARKMTLPAAIPAKAQYMFQDLRRWAALYGVPLTMPKVFPVNSLLANRVAVAGTMAGHGEAVALALLGAYWARGEDISQEAVLREALSTAGLPAEDWLAAATTDPVKTQLRANTDEALACGVFGAPTMRYGKALFWGNDRLDLLEAVISGRIPA